MVEIKIIYQLLVLLEISLLPVRRIRHVIKCRSSNALIEKFFLNLADVPWMRPTPLHCHNELTLKVDDVGSEDLEVEVSPRHAFLGDGSPHLWSLM